MGNTEQSTEMVTCCHCDEEVESSVCGWYIGWICPRCIPIVWDKYCERVACE